MSVAQWMSQNRGAAIGIAIAMVLLIVTVAMRAKPGAALENQRYFYDLKTGKAFTGDRLAMPPIAGADGAQGGGLVMFGCGDCSEPKPGWVETFTPMAHEATRKLGEAGPEDGNPQQFVDAISRGHMVAAVPKAGEEAKWIVFDSPEGAHLRSSLKLSACGGGQAELCLP